MRKEKTLFILGLWIIILPFLGLPSLWKNILFAITGLMLFYLSYLFKYEAKSRIDKIENRAKTFVDSANNNKDLNI